MDCECDDDDDGPLKELQLLFTEKYLFGVTVCSELPPSSK